MRLLLPLLAVSSLHAQLPAPNPQGVAMGHLHLNTADTDASRRFWVDFLGGTPAKFGGGEVFKFPGVIVMTRKTEVNAGSEGSAVNHLGFKVKDLDAMHAKCKSMGFTVAQVNPDTRQIFVMTPDNVKVELTEDKSLAEPVVHHHIHFFNQAPLETQAWYARHFGAIPGKRAKFDAADLPGVNLTFSPSETKTEPTKGRAMDHIGFEVKNLEAFCKKLEAEGVKFDMPYRNVQRIGLAIAFFTDPWGTYVELTEGLDKI